MFFQVFFDVFKEILLKNFLSYFKSCSCEKIFKNDSWSHSVFGHVVRSKLVKKACFGCSHVELFLQHFGCECTKRWSLLKVLFGQHEKDSAKILWIGFTVLIPEVQQVVYNLVVVNNYSMFFNCFKVYIKGEANANEGLRWVKTWPETFNFSSL